MHAFAAPLGLAAFALSACSSLPPQQSVPRTPYFGAVPSEAVTPADAALECLSRSPEVRANDKIFAVHIINDQTQKYTQEDSGGFVPVDSAGMMVTALSKAGVRQVNRVNTAVPEFEINLAREQILGDGRAVSVGDETVQYRPIMKGALLGSDYVIDGALTQLDFNTYSSGAEATVQGVGGGSRVFALTTGADLRVTDTRSTEILKAKSYTKQAAGREVFASIFRFFSDEDLYDVKIGSKTNEGLHMGVRWMLSEAAYDIVSDLTNHNGSCDQYLPQATQDIRNEGSSAEVTVLRDEATPARL